MNNGYREITEEEGATCQAGDQYKFRNEDWEIVESRHHGARYDAEGFDESIYRRPIAHYATPTEKVVENLADGEVEDSVCAFCGDMVSPVDHKCGQGALDATANAPDEWKDGFPPVGFQLVSEIAIGWLFDNHRETYKGFYDRIDETQSQIEEREREEKIADLKERTKRNEFQLALRSMWCDKQEAIREPITKRSLSKWTYDWLKSTDQLKDKSDA